MFVFDDFANVFAEQVIPSIVLERIEEVFHFNVAKLRVFGRSYWPKHARFGSKASFHSSLRHVRCSSNRYAD